MTNDTPKTALKPHELAAQALDLLRQACRLVDEDDMNKLQQKCYDALLTARSETRNAKLLLEELALAE